MAEAVAVPRFRVKGIRKAPSQTGPFFSIPKGKSPSEGTYVDYPCEDRLAIIALESVRSTTLVIGEDLGTVPDWVREHLAKARVLSYRVFYFERRGDGAWKLPNEYPQ